MSLNLILASGTKKGLFVIRSVNKRARQQKLLKLIKQNPLLTDKELSETLCASLGTVRLDRALLGIPEVRERMRTMAEKATSRLRSLKQEEVIGELLELEPNKWALSMLQARKDMVFRHTDLIWDHYIYAHASSLAIAVIEADMVIVTSMRGRFRSHARVGDIITARAKVGIHKGNKYIVSVRTKVRNEEIFVGRFIVSSIFSDEMVRPEGSVEL